MAELLFPFGGINRLTSWQAQPPYTTRNAYNVMARETIEGSIRGGSRPGLVKAFAEQVKISGTASGVPVYASGQSTITSAGTEFIPEHVGSTFKFGTSGATYPIVTYTSTSQVKVKGDASGETSGDTFTVYGPIRMAEIVRTNEIQSSATYVNSFTDSNDVTAASWADTGMTISGGRAVGSLTDGVDATSTLTAAAAPAINDAVDYSVVGLIGGSVPTLSTSYQVKYSLFAGMHDSSPNRTTSVSVVFIFLEDDVTPGTFRIDVRFYFNNTLISAANSVVENLSSIDTQLLMMKVKPSGATATIQAFRFSVSDPGLTKLHEWSSPFTAAGGNIGFGTEIVGADADVAPSFDEVAYSYYVASPNLSPEALVVAGNGQIFAEREGGSLQEIATYNGMTVASDRLLTGADRLGKLYIADYGLRLEAIDSGGVVTAGVLDDAGITWDAHNIDKDGDVVELTTISGGVGALSSGTLGGTAGYFGIASIHATNGLTLKDLSTGTSLTTGDDCTSCNYRVIRGMKVYNSTTDALSLYTATDGLGDPPHGCTILTVYRDRIVCGGDPNYPGVWFMSRQGDPNDWAYGYLDAQSATASTSSNSETGGLPAPISALIPHSEDYLLIGARSEWWVLRGDPMLGGTLSNLSQIIGPTDKHAWCYTPSGALYALTRDGIYMINPGAVSAPVPVSRYKLPRELLDVDTSLNTVNMEYDPSRAMIHIYIVSDTGVVFEGLWLYELENQAFWTVQFAPSYLTNKHPTATCYNPLTNVVLLCGKDGYVRRFDNNAEDDDGDNFGSSVTLGPIRMTDGMDREGMITEVSAVLDHFSGDVTWYVVSGDQNQFPANITAGMAGSGGTWSADSNYITRPNARGRVAYVVIEGTPGSRWAMESVTIRRRAIGPFRKR